MSEQPHCLSFGPVGDIVRYHAVHVLPPKIADTPTLTCACGCGLRIFVYYRLEGLKEVSIEHEEEGNEE